MSGLSFFEEYIKKGVVKRIKADVERAKSLVNTSERKINSLKNQIEKLGVQNENANDYIEYCHDILMLLIRAKMLTDGYSASGQEAHKAEVAYLRNFKFNEADIQFLDKLRFFRNGMLYYGTILDKEYAEKVIKFTKRISIKLREMLK